MRTGRLSPSWSPNRDNQVEPVATHRAAQATLELIAHAMLLSVS